MEDQSKVVVGIDKGSGFDKQNLLSIPKQNSTKLLASVVSNQSSHSNNNLINSLTGISSINKLTGIQGLFSSKLFFYSLF